MDCYLLIWLGNSHTDRCGISWLLLVLFPVSAAVVPGAEMRGGCPLVGPLRLALYGSTLSSVTSVINDFLLQAFQRMRVKTNIDHSYICTARSDEQSTPK